MSFLPSSLITFLKVIALGGGAIAVPFTIDSLQSHTYQSTGAAINSSEHSIPEYSEEFMKQCEDNSKLTVKLTDGSTKTVNKEGLMKLIKENEKTPDLKEIEWPEGCKWETQSSSES